MLLAASLGFILPRYLEEGFYAGPPNKELDQGSAEQDLSLYLRRSCNLVTIRCWQLIARALTIKAACYLFSPRGSAHLAS